MGRERATMNYYTTLIALFLGLQGIILLLSIILIALIISYRKDKKEKEGRKQ